MAAETVVYGAELPFVFAVASAEETSPLRGERTGEGPSAALRASACATHSSRPEPEPELSVYRQHTIALLRRYLQYSIETGRLPSLVGREFFRSRTSCVRPHTFEDAVHFVIDVEHCLTQLDPFSQQLIVRVVLQEYSWDETARLLRVCRRTVASGLPVAIDRLTELLLAKKILQENGRKR